MKLSVIAAVARNGIIGRDNALPWRLAADLGRFKRLTMGHPMIMGRKTFESIGRILPGRRSIVITRRRDYPAEGATVVDSWDAALEAAADAEEAFVVGGASLYALALPVADRLYLTEVEASVGGDVRFPFFDHRDFKVVREERVPRDDKNEYATVFRVYERIEEEERRHG